MQTLTLAPRLFSELTSSSTRRALRMASGLSLFVYIGSHLLNHALGLISLDAAEAGMGIAIEVWYSVPGTLLLYGAAAMHFALALWAVYERRTFLLPPLEILRIALGFTLPILLIGHAANTRLAWEVLGLPSDYTRVVSNLLVTGSQGWQLGLMAPGWLHGCLGLNYAFNRRPLFRKFRFVLFAIALVLPILSALGFIAMGRELAARPDIMAAALEYLKPANSTQTLAILQWRDNLLFGYFSIIGAAFVAREIRNALEKRRDRLVSISYPGQTVRVPRGWSVLEASRSFHLPHASMCGGRARCSTCRVQVTAGEENCGPIGSDENATLARIGGPAGVRLACQLRPEGDVAVVPLVRTAQPIYRQTAPQRDAGQEREIVVLFCDFRNRAELVAGHLPQDLLYVMALYIEALGTAIGSAGGTVSYIEPDSACALFGLRATPALAARRALQAANTIERVIANLNGRLGLQSEGGLKIAVTIHAGRAVVGEIGASDPPTMMAVGEVMDMADEIRAVATDSAMSFAISETVFLQAGVVPPVGEKTLLRAPGPNDAVSVFLSEAAPMPSPAWTLDGQRGGRARLARFWSRPVP